MFEAYESDIFKCHNVQAGKKVACIAQGFVLYVKLLVFRKLFMGAANLEHMYYSQKITFSKLM